MQARGFLNYRLKYCWSKDIYCTCQPNELEREIKKNWEAKQGAKQKYGEATAHPAPQPPLESPLRTVSKLQPAGKIRPAKTICQ